MSDLLEIMFETVPGASLLPFLSRLVDEDQIQRISHSDIGELDRNSQLSEHLNAGSESAAAVMSIFLRKVSLGLTTVRGPLLRVLWYDGQCDVSMSFERDDLWPKADGMVARVQADVLNLKRAYEIGDCYFGLDPAADEQTRYFTGASFGPLLDG